MTPMIDEDCLVAALADVYFDRSKIEINASPVALDGYEGDRRAPRQPASILNVVPSRR